MLVRWAFGVLLLANAVLAAYLGYADSPPSENDFRAREVNADEVKVLRSGPPVTSSGPPVSSTPIRSAWVVRARAD